MISKNTITINKEVYDRLKERRVLNESYNKIIDYIVDKHSHSKKFRVNDSDFKQKGIELPDYLMEQGILRIVPYPSNLIKNGIITNKPLIINLLIVTKYRTLKVSTKNYKTVLKSVHNFSIKYNLRGLVNYIIDNYEALTFIDKETLKQYYETELKIKEFEEIGNLVDTDSEEVQKI